MSEGSREGQKRDLLLESLGTHGSIRLRALGTSMVPSIWPGDIVAVERNCDPIEMGTIILAVRDDRLFVHRVVAIPESAGSVRIVTRGDALDASDPAIGRNQVLGRICGIYRQGRKIIPGRELGVLAWLVARTFSRFAFLRSLLLRLHSVNTRKEQETRDELRVPYVFLREWESSTS